MNAPFPVADTLSAAPLAAPVDPAAAVHAAALLILPHLERGARVDATTLRGAMESAFGASDATGRSPAILPSNGNAETGGPALRKSALPYLRRNRTVAASHAS